MVQYTQFNKYKYSRKKYVGESVNRSQMNTTRKRSEIRTCKNNLFLGITSTNIDTLVPSLYQCVETRSIKVSSTSAPPFETCLLLCTFDLYAKVFPLICLVVQNAGNCELSPARTPPSQLRVLIHHKYCHYASCMVKKKLSL
jgi:hypothetical protein